MSQDLIKQDWLGPVTKDEIAFCMEWTVDSVSKKQLSSLALFMLEMHRPIAYPLTHLLMGCSPLLIPFWGHNRLNAFCHIVGDKILLNQLIDRLESAAGKNAE
jgi:hypothetical protein